MIEQIAKDEQKLLLISQITEEIKKDKDLFFNIKKYEYNHNSHNEYYNIFYKLMSNPNDVYAQIVGNLKKSIKTIWFDIKSNMNNMNFWLILMLLLISFVEREKLAVDPHFNILKISFEYFTIINLKDDQCLWKCWIINGFFLF
jgi:hypothetical protein